MDPRRRLVAMLLALVIVPLVAGDALAERIRCSSRDYRYAFCGTRQRIVSAWVVKRHSKRPCNEFRTWGWQRDGIWVDDGCDAEFEVVLRDFGPGPRPPLPGPPVQGPPPGVNPSPWTVGEWQGQGYRLSVYRGGSVVMSPRRGVYERGYMNGSELTLYDGTRLRAQRDQNRLRLTWPNGRGLVLSRTS
jgi:Protein of unknown function (DUF3011)